MTATALRSDHLLDPFELPDHLVAASPPETRGLHRDGVRLMITTSASVDDLRFADLDSTLRSGDVLVVNNSATIPAAVDIDEVHTLHFSTRLPGGLIVVEPRVRSGAGSSERSDTTPGIVHLPDGARIELLAPYPVGAEFRRLWVAAADIGVPLDSFLARHGRPISYQHTPGHFPLAAYQTVFALDPGSAEMPSAGGPFSHDLVSRLVSMGVIIVPITLHTGVSSLEAGETPYAEWYRVAPTAARVINHARGSGGRVVAVGTTVVRALHTVSDERGSIYPGSGWTDIVIGPGDEVDSIDGLITGWHEPESSHLALLEAVAGRSALSIAYERALSVGYLWHEFGDSLLILR